jgi:SAM-dependent methyltransferase
LGIDFTLGMTRACRRRGRRVAAQGPERPGLRGRFDRVLCIGTLESTHDPSTAVAALAALLRPGGRLVLLHPRPLPLGVLSAFYHRRHGVAIRLFGRADVRAPLTAAGLTWPDAVQWSWPS